MNRSFGILGSLDVRVDGEPIAIAGPRQQALLALLLLNRNRRVTAERILDGLWPDDLPASGRAALQMGVSRLRRSLAGRGATGDVLVTVAGGYLLRTGPGEVDADAFERLAAAGRSALAAGDPARAAEALGSALELWRGDALPELADAAFAAGEIARLADLRLSAQEDHVEARLALGGHADVTAELERLITTHPHRERLRRQLMLALYRSGRQADALAIYRSARRALVTDLGIEPGPELRQLEAAVLRQDAALEGPAPIAAARPLVPDERKLATALVAELVVTGEDPERIRLRVARFAAAAEQAVARAGGWIEHSTGAIVVAAFGVPVACDDHADRALRVALDLVAAEPVRIGIDTGEVLVSGSDTARLLIVGEAVQLALGLARRAAPGEAIVGQRCRAIVQHGFAWDGGRLLGVPAAARPRDRSREAAFIGRAPELARLSDAMARARAEHAPQLVTVVGEAGVGKSSLARRFAADAAPDVVVRTGRCLPYGQGITYWPLGEVIRAELGMDEDAPAVGVADRLGAHSAAAAILGLDVMQDQHPATARERVHSAWVGWVSAVAARQPLVVVVEDIHWAEDDLLDLVERTAAEATGPLVLLTNARPELRARRPSFGARARTAGNLRLQPLGDPEARQLVHELLGGAASPDVADLVLSRAEGNPFFVEETIAALIERGSLERTGHAWRLNALPAEMEVADTIHAALASRIDLLPAPAKQALRAAAVIGTTFSARAVASLAAGEASSIDELVEREFVRPVDGLREDDPRYAFKHALTRDVAYNGLTKTQRSRLHLDYAAWLEVGRGGPDEDSPFLAHHYAEAANLADADVVWIDRAAEHERVRALAARWLERAALVAFRRGGVRESASMLERAVELEPEPAALSALLRTLAHSYAVLYDGQAFQAALERCAELSGDVVTRGEVAAELAYQSWLRPSLWQQAQDTAQINRWIAEALELNPAPTASRVKSLTARAWFDPVDGPAAAAEAIEIAEALGRDDLRFLAYLGSSERAVEANQPIEAMAWATRLRSLADATDDPDTRAWVEWGAAFANAACGQIDAARHCAHEHDRIVALLTPHHAIHGLGVQMMIDELAGRWDEIRAEGDRLERAVAANAASRCHLDRRALLDCALAAHLAGDEEEANRLQILADRVQIAGGGITVEAPRLRIAILHRDAPTVECVLAEQNALNYGGLGSTSARLDALAWLDRRAEVESITPALLQPGMYLEPFALRALGVVRRDDDLLEQAYAAFIALGLNWHAAETVKR